MKRSIYLSAVIPFLFTLSAPLVSAQSLDPVLKYLPAETNVMTFLNVDGLLKSPLGIEKDWSTKHEQAYVDGSLTIPPWVKQFVRASHFIPGAGGESWALGMVSLDSKDRLQEIAKLEGNEIQDLNGFKILFSSKYGGYFTEIDLEDVKSELDILALLTPASRQETARWIDSFRAGTKISKYLQSSVQDLKPQLILAMDMEHLLDPVQIRYRLEGNAAIKAKPAAKSALTLDFQALQGVRMTVTASDALNAEFRFDFKRSIGNEAEYMRSLFVEFLNDAGHSLDEFADAAVSVEGKSVLLKTALTDESFRKLLSLISTPHPAHGVKKDDAPTPRAPTPGYSDSPYDMAASKRYYNAVIKALRDLEKSYLNSNSTYARTAGWHKSYANKIEKMSTSGVHPDLLKFGDNMAQDLKILADSLRGSQVEYNDLNSKVRYQKEYKYNPKTGYEWWWGPPRTAYGYVATPQNTDVIVHTNADEIRKKQQQAGEQGAEQRKQIWSQMSEQRDAVKNEMTKVFGEEFLTP
ncbi:MAG: hypothetical protein HON04_01930 [Planctomicrobium sp.]|jgi:hypothetical protein|nr:hypothetical protein [Planctomicrobium sp.]